MTNKIKLKKTRKKIGRFLGISFSCFLFTMCLGFPYFLDKITPIEAYNDSYFKRIFEGE